MFGNLEAGGKVSRTKYAEDFTVDMVNHKYVFEELAEIIKKYCVVIKSYGDAKKRPRQVAFSSGINGGKGSRTLPKNIATQASTGVVTVLMSP
ncbi:hypothetical protein B4V02_24255 [Paenibacillus kribbensis]|uniref:Uncharacterized protein n=1 Tax=Paenibacillus kribbensis TaxID=172713 RepID=A0A222WTT7_9BACL|nr:hypothetical protein B4V02_24255 [Paenibacillus kribbensis]